MTATDSRDSLETFLTSLKGVSCRKNVGKVGDYTMDYFCLLTNDGESMIQAVQEMAKFGQVRYNTLPKGAAYLFVAFVVV